MKLVKNRHRANGSKTPQHVNFTFIHTFTWSRVPEGLKYNDVTSSERDSAALRVRCKSASE